MSTGTRSDKIVVCCLYMSRRINGAMLERENAAVTVRTAIIIMGICNGIMGICKTHIELIKKAN